MSLAMSTARIVPVLPQPALRGEDSILIVLQDYTEFYGMDKLSVSRSH